MADTEAPQLFPCGMSEMLFGGPGGILLMMDNDNEQTIKLLSVGTLLCFAIQTVHPIMATICSLGTFHWPISKDYAVYRVTERIFVFPMPGNIYVFQFNRSTMNAVLDMAENLFNKYSKYTVLEGENGYCLSDDDPFVWKKLRQTFQGLAMVKIYLTDGVPKEDLPEDIGNNVSCLTRATRLSAACKFISSSLLYGTVKPQHFQILNDSAAGAGNPNGDEDPAFGCGSVFFAMALEVELRSIMSVGRPLGDVEGILNRYGEKLDGIKKNGGVSGVKMWKLSPEGLKFFMRMWEMPVGLFGPQQPQIDIV